MNFKNSKPQNLKSWKLHIKIWNDFLWKLNKRKRNCVTLVYESSESSVWNFNKVLIQIFVWSVADSKKENFIRFCLRVRSQFFARWFWCGYAKWRVAIPWPFQVERESLPEISKNTLKKIPFFLGFILKKLIKFPFFVNFTI